MVAEKLISKLSESLCQDYDSVTLGDVPYLNLTNGAPGSPVEQYDSAKIQESETNCNRSNTKDNGNKDNLNEKGKTNTDNENLEKTPVPVESTVDNFCDVVVSFRCKFCMFIASDKVAVKQHVNQVHSSNFATGSQQVESHDRVQNQLQLPETDNNVLRSSPEFARSLPPLPRPGTPQGPNLKNGCQREELDQGHDKDRENLKGTENENEKDEVFFCSKCSIIFSSALLCCNHMVEVHQLREFCTDLIRENPLNAHHQPSPPKRKRIRCSKQSQLSPAPTTDKSGNSRLLRSKKSKQSPNPNGSNGPNGTATSVELMCKLCKTKFTTLPALQTHEKCHISVPEGTQQAMGTVKKSKSYKPYKPYVVKGYICCYCDVNKVAGAGTSSGGSSNDNCSNSSESGNSSSAVTKFLTWAKCALHLWKDHEVDCDLYTCSVCKYKTPTSAKLKDHELLHNSEAKFTCSTCRKSFKQFKQLKNHEKYHKVNNTKLPPGSEARWYTPKECPICNRILSDSKCLKKHISAVHNKMKPYVCNICGHTSARKAELQLHIRQHTGEKPYKCPACPFSTGDHNSLRKHKLRHVEDKTRPYECSYCDYAAIQSHAFKKHVLAVHPGQEIVFVCSVCGLVCVNENAFDAHRKDHEEGRIPVESSNVSNIHGMNGVRVKSSTVVSVDESTRASTESAESNDGKMSAASKFWLRDEDSMEVVDTGGITIPAPVITLSSGSSGSGSGSDSMDKDEVNENRAAAATVYGGHSSHDGDSDTDTRNDNDSCSSIAHHTLTSHHSHHQNGKGSEMDLDRTSSSSDSVDPAANNRTASPGKCFGGLNAHSLSNGNGHRADSNAVPNFGLGGMDESRAISIVTELLSDSDCNTLSQFLNFDPVLCSSDSIDLPDLLCNEHSNDGTLEKLLNMNVTGFS